MRHLATALVLLSLPLVSLPAFAADPPAKKSDPAPAKGAKGKPTATPEPAKAETPPEPASKESTPAASTTETTSAAAPEEPADPNAAVRDKAEKEAARRRAEAEARSGFQVAPLIGFGVNSTTLKQGFFGLNGESEKVGAMGFGAGVRGGYVLVRGMYVGGVFLYHVGESRNVQGGKVEGGLAYGGVELGQQVYAGPVIIRPYGGAGYASVTLKAPIGNQQVDASGGKVALWLGVTPIVPITPTFFAGVDARYLAVLGVDKEASASGFTFAATGGAKF